MAAPNLANTTIIYGKTLAYNATTTTNAVALTCPTNKVLKINTILIIEESSYDMYVDFYDSSEAIQIRIFDTAQFGYASYTRNDPQFIVTKDNYFYLEEGDQIRIWTESSYGPGDRKVMISYEEIDDA